MQNILKSALKDRVLKKAKLPKIPNAVKDKLPERVKCPNSLKRIQF